VALLKPSKENFYFVEHVTLIRESLIKFTGKDLVCRDLSDEDAAREVFYAPFAVVSHDTSEDPVFNYANETALKLFEMRWEEFVSLPSRLSAEVPDREKRSRLLKEVSSKGFIDHYSGIRISKSGKRFFIKKATVWNLFNEQGFPYGQAATFSDWEYL